MQHVHGSVFHGDRASMQHDHGLVGSQRQVGAEHEHGDVYARGRASTVHGHGDVYARGRASRASTEQELALSMSLEMYMDQFGLAKSSCLKEFALKIGLGVSVACHEEIEMWSKMVI